MNSTRGRNDGSLLSFSMQDFGALSGVDERDVAPIRLVTPEQIERAAPATQSHSDALDAPIEQQHVAHQDVPDLQRTGPHIDYSYDHATEISFTPDDHGGHPVSIGTSDAVIVSQYTGVATIAPSLYSAPFTQAFAGSADMAVVAAPQYGVDTSHSRQGDFHFDAASHGGSSPILPPSGPVAGQLWFGGAGDGTGNPDGHSDFRVERADSDGLVDDQIIVQEQNAGGINQSIGLDTSAGLFFSLSEDFHLRVSSIATGAVLTDTVVASTADFDTVNAIAVDAVHNVIYMDLDGYDYVAHGGDIIKITYNQTTGAITSPYTWNDTTHTGSVDTHGILIDSQSTGNVYNDGRAFYLTHDGSTLYYVDDDDNVSIGPPPAAWRVATNGVYKVSTTGDVGDGNAPTPVLLSSQAQFPVNDSNGYITGIAVDEARSIIYFTTDSGGNGGTSLDALWWMPITGGTATKMTIPGGVSVTHPVFFGDNIEIDPKSHTLYYADQSTGEVVQFVLSADGHSFASATNFALFDTNHTSDAAYANSMVFDDLPTLASLSATSTEAVQGGSAITLLTATPSITDIDNVNLNHFTITITNAQTGDNLFCNGAQSGTQSGVTISWNSSTHTLTLSGDVSFATYQTLLTQISYQDSGTDNSTGSHPTRIINWTASDGVTDVHASTADSNEQTTTVVIDRAPTLTADNYNDVEAATVTGTSGTGGTGVLGNDNDKDGDAIVVTAVNGSGANVGNSVAGTYGHLTLNSNGSLSYIADNAAAIAGAATGSHLTDTFTYTVSDGLGGVTTSTVTITLDRVPTVVADAPSTQAVESGSQVSGNVLSNDSDRDGDTLTVSAVNGVGGNVGASVSGTYGHINIGSNGSYSYSADITAAIDAAATGSHLTDSFSYTANDGHGGTTTTTITITIDRPPTAVADASSSDAVESGTHATGNVLTNDSDRDADSLAVSAVNGLAGNVNASVAGTYGHITIQSNGSYDYTADKTSAIDAAATGSHLTDSFTYQASDGHGGFATQTVTITLDRAPTVVADSSSSDAVESSTDATGNVLSNDSDRDGDTLSVSAVNGVGGNVGASVAGTYGHITINANGTYDYTADKTSAIDAAATGSHLTDSFTYTASDGFGGFSTQTITITIDRPPTAVADSSSSDAVENSTHATGNVLSNDSDRDGDILSVSAVNGVGGNVGASVAGTYGHITINANGTYDYTADNTSAIDSAATGSHLTDSFTYTASDGLGGFASQTITITLDRAPTVVVDSSSSDAVESGTDATGNVLSNDSDRDGDTLTVSAVNGVAGNVNASVAGTYGHITINTNGSYDYTADKTSAIDAAATGSHLTDSFTYQASDGFGGFATQTVTITLDRAPTVVNDNYGSQLTEGASTGLINAASGVLANDSDRDGDSLTVYSVGGNTANVGNSFATTYGHVTMGADGSYTYTADQTGAIDAAPTGSHPVDTISFVVTDGFGGFSTETLSITLDRPAVASADSLGTTESTQAVNGVGGNQNLLANDVDKDGDPITITAVNGSGANVGTQIVLASGALLTLNSDGTYTYDPNHAFDWLAGASSGASDTSATDTFTYTVDGGSTVTVTVTVNGLDSNDTLIGTSGNDNLNGGIGDDIIYDDNGLNSGKDPHDTSSGKSGGTDVFNGGSGNDRIYMGGNLTASDQIDGSTGTDSVNLNGDYSSGLVFNATTMVNVEVLQLTAGHSYNLTMNNATVAFGQTLTVHGGTLGAGDQEIFDGSADTTGGSFIVNAGAGNDTLTGGNGNDIFNSGSGTDTIHGGGGNDTAYFVGNLTAADSFDGGAGNDTVNLDGTYAGLTLGANTFVSVESLVLVGGFTYNLTMNAATVAAGSTMTVRGASLGPSDGLTFNASADTAGGNYLVYSGSGNDVLTGGNGNDFFNPGSGTDTVHAGGGNDSIEMNGTLTAADTIDGGSGTDTLFLNGDYSGGLTLGATTVTNIERVTLAAGHNYNLTINNATVTAGNTMTFAGNALHSSDSFVFDGSHDTSGGSLVIDGGAGSDTLTGGWTNDVIKAGDGTNIITGGGGSDMLWGGSGADTFVYNAVSDSTSTGYDKVENFDTSMDVFKFSGTLAGTNVTGIDTAITHGLLAGGHFDAELTADVNSSNLAAHHAVLFTADSGNLSGHTFLVVDVNGVAGYQAGQDLVIDVTGGSNLASLSTSDFTH